MTEFQIENLQVSEMRYTIYDELSKVCIGLFPNRSMANHELDQMGGHSFSVIPIVIFKEHYEDQP